MDNSFWAVLGRGASSTQDSLLSASVSSAGRGQLQADASLIPESSLSCNSLPASECGWGQSLHGSFSASALKTKVFILCV